MTKECPTHHKLFREGKYGWYCATKVNGGWCKEKPKTESPSEKFNRELDTKEPQMTKEETQEDQKWKAIREEKTSSIRWMNSLNNATILVASRNYPSQIISNSEEYAEQISYWAEWFYHREPIL